MAFKAPPHTMPTTGQQLATVMDIVTKNSIRDPILNQFLFGSPIFMAFLCWGMRGFFQPGLRTFGAKATTLCAMRPGAEDCSWWWPDEDGCSCWYHIEAIKDFERRWATNAVLPERVAFVCDVPSELKDE